MNRSGEVDVDSPFRFTHVGLLLVHWRIVASHGSIPCQPHLSRPSVSTVRSSLSFLVLVLVLINRFVGLPLMIGQPHLSLIDFSLIGQIDLPRIDPSFL